MGRHRKPRGTLDDAKAGNVRDDVAPPELASYCLHALPAASSLPSKAAGHRFVAVTLHSSTHPVESSLDTLVRGEIDACALRSGGRMRRGPPIEADQPVALGKLTDHL